MADSQGQAWERGCAIGSRMGGGVGGEETEAGVMEAELEAEREQLEDEGMEVGEILRQN